MAKACDYYTESDIVILQKIALKYSRGGTLLAMPKTSCVPNISSFKTSSGATEGVLDYGVLRCPGYVTWAEQMGRDDTR